MGKTIANLCFQEIRSDPKFVIPEIVSIKPKLIVKASTLREKIREALWLLLFFNY